MPNLIVITKCNFTTNHNLHVLMTICRNRLLTTAYYFRGSFLGSMKMQASRINRWISNIPYSLPFLLRCIFNVCISSWLSVFLVCFSLLQPPWRWRSRLERVIGARMWQKTGSYWFRKPNFLTSLIMIIFRHHQFQCKILFRPILIIFTRNLKSLVCLFV